MPMPPYPVIVVPGITAVYLHDQYALPPDVVWSVTTREYGRAALHPDNLRYEAIEPSRIVLGQIFEVAYRELIEELRHNLRLKEDLPVPVFPFSYDWRQPIETSEQQLALFIDEAIARTSLLRHYAKEGYGDAPKVNLVGHSMGGLVIAGYLESAGNNHRVHKVATLATPFQGSFESLTKITTGTASLGESASSSREREAARLTPALYQLLPSFEGGVVPDPGLPTSLFDPGVWQPSIINSIKEFIRLHGLGKAANRDQQARALFNGLLAAGASHRGRMDTLDLGAVGLRPDDWLCVVGVDSKTRVRLKVVKPGPEFSFLDDDEQNEWRDPDPRVRRLTGDGTVPFEGAVPKFLSEENLVCVTPEDFGTWEVQDRVISSVAGFHGILPNMDMLHRMMVAHFTGRPGRYGNIWGRLPPGVDKEKWRPPIADLRDKR